MGGSLVDGGGGRDARPAPSGRLAEQALARGLRVVYREPVDGRRVYGEVVRLDGSREWVVGKSD